MATCETAVQVGQRHEKVLVAGPARRDEKNNQKYISFIYFICLTPLRCESPLKLEKKQNPKTRIPNELFNWKLMSIPIDLNLKIHKDREKRFLR